MTFSKKKELTSGTPNWLYDKPRDTDRPMQELFGTEVERPEELLLWNNIERQNQRLERIPSTKMACWSYGIGQAVNVMNSLEMSDEYIQCHELRNTFVDMYRAKYIREKGIDPLTHWSWLQDQLDLARQRNYIAWYGVVTTEEEIDSAITRGQIIYTGSDEIDWEATKRNNNVAVIVKSWPWHAFHIDWFTATHYRCRNSGGNKYMDKWWFWIEKKDIWHLFTKYALIDQKDQQVLDDMIEKILEAKKRIRLWHRPTTVIEKIAYNNMVRDGEIKI